MDRNYFQQIEATFVRLRGAPLLLSPEDWQLARSWFERGIPLDLVLQTLEQVFELRAERGAAGKIHGLKYCAEAVDSGWKETESLLAPAYRAAPTVVLGDLASRLAALGDSLPSGVTDRDHWQRQILRLVEQEGSEAAERELRTLDHEFLRAQFRALDGDTRNEFEGEATLGRATLEARLSGDDLDRAYGSLFRRLLRERLGLPRLSLFTS